MDEPGRINLITPTRNRPQAFDLLQAWMARQTYSGPIQWLVVNDGNAEYEYRLGQTVLNRRSDGSEGHSICANLLLAFEHVRGDAVLIIEDDDWYAPTYIAEMAVALAKADLVGSTPAVYYNIRNRRMRTFENPSHSSLAQTGFRRSVLDLATAIAKRGLTTIDQQLWRDFNGSKLLIPNRRLQVGIKGMPGEPGIGVGHKKKKGAYDRDFSILRDLIGDDASRYVAIHESMPKDPGMDGSF